MIITKTRYFVVRDFIVEDLEYEVERRLSLDWKLQGGICLFSKDKCRPMFCQAMIKETVESGLTKKE